MSAVLLALVGGVHALFSEPPLEPAPKDDAGPSPMRALLRLEIVALLGAQFMALFAQIGLESIVTPVSTSYFSFTPLWTSVFFAAITGELLLVYVATSFVVSRVQDRVSVALAYAWALSGTALLVAFAWASLPGHLTLWQVRWVVCGWSALTSLQFGLACGVLVVSLPLFESTVGSLYSKLIAARGIQGRGQGVLGAVMSLATVVAPLSSAGLLTLGLQWVVLCNLVALTLAASLFLLAFRRLDVSVPAATERVEPEGHGTTIQEGTESETDPLLVGPGTDSGIEF